MLAPPVAMSLAAPCSIKPPVSEALAKPSAVVASALVQSLRPVRPSGSDGQGPPSQAQSRRSLAPARQHSVFHVKQSTVELKGMRCMAIRLIAAKPPASARLQASHERLSPTAAASIATQPSACCRPLPVPRRHPRYTRYPSLGGESRSTSKRWGTGQSSVGPAIATIRPSDRIGAVEPLPCWKEAVAARPLNRRSVTSDPGPSVRHPSGQARLHLGSGFPGRVRRRR
jgi:hypothetical protein